MPALPNDESRVSHLPSADLRKKQILFPLLFGSKIFGKFYSHAKILRFFPPAVHVLIYYFFQSLLTDFNIKNKGLHLLRSYDAEEVQAFFEDYGKRLSEC